MPDDQKATPHPVQVDSYFAPDYHETYANQAFYEPSAWDLKIIFGQLDQSTGAARIKKTFGLNIPWAQVKLASFALKVQFEANELQNGKVSIRRDLWPPEPIALTPEQENDPAMKAVVEMYKRLREEFLKEVGG